MYDGDYCCLSNTYQSISVWTVDETALRPEGALNFSFAFIIITLPFHQLVFGEAW